MTAPPTVLKATLLCLPSLGLDLRIGFTNNFYDKTKWKYGGETITGPALKLDAMPLFRFGVVFAK